MSVKSQEQVDAIVVGGGAIGLAIALELTSHGVKVTNVFPAAEDLTSATRAAGAMLGAFGEVTADDGHDEAVEFNFRLAAQRRYPSWLETIKEQSKLPVFQAQGTFIIANNHGIRDRDAIHLMKKKAGEQSEPAEWVEPSEVPGLNPSKPDIPSQCLYLANEHSVNSGELLDAIKGALEQRKNYHWIDASVTQINRNGEAWVAKLSNGTSVTAGSAVLAGGARAIECLSDELLVDTGVPEMYFGKGVACVVSDAPAVPSTIRTPNRAFACGIHLVPRPGNGNLYVGATNFLVQNKDIDTRIQPAELHGLFDETIHQLNTQLRTSWIEEIRVGFRPITMFRRPAIGRTNLTNLYLATGTYRNGILMAPLVAEIIAYEMGARSIAPTVQNPYPVSERGSNSNSIDRIMQIGVRDIVAFLQEPNNPLPYNRSGELEHYLRTLFSLVMSDDESSEQLRNTIRRRLAEAPFNETMHMLYYDLVEQAAARESRDIA
jgi:glycine/D-amino acid oxidase-like deaminating enzyme